MKIVAVLFVSIFISWIPEQISPRKKQLLKADEAFSALSRQKGMKYAFLKFMDKQGVLLRPNNYPLIANDARALLQKTNDSTFTLTWKPQDAFIAKSGELGYTYGIYTLDLKDTSLRGTYVSVWKKQKDGNWKFVLDSGNGGLGK